MNRKQRNNKKRWFVYEWSRIGIWRAGSFYRHPQAEGSRVNDNRRRARLLGKHGIYSRKKASKHEYGLPAKYVCSWRQKTYRKLCRLWHKLPHVKIKWGGRHNKGSKTI